MTSLPTFPNPYLVAILLVCNTRTGYGAQVLFQYPQRPSPHDEVAVPASSALDQADAETSTDSQQSSSDEDELLPLVGTTSRSYPQSQTSWAKTSGEDDERALKPTLSGQNGNRKQHAVSLFGLAEDGLVSLLSPDRMWHKRRFEMGINDLTFVGRPVFARPDGCWRKAKINKPRPDDNPGVSDTATDDEESTEVSTSVKNDSVGGQQAAIANNAKSPLTMFHVVFVMNPPALEHAMRVKDMYDHVIKKLSRALKWEQAHNDYFWKEAEIISSVKTFGQAQKFSPTAIFNEILAKSSLAVAISHIYTAISDSQIASVTLSPKVSFSLQIPPVTSTASLPSLTDPPIQPGLWLTTATDIGSTGDESKDAETDHTLHLAKHYTLLLKSPPQRIAKESLEAGGPLAVHLPKFVSSLRPTKSFHKLSISSQVSLADIQVLASHLIYWRRAVAIPPLHSKDIYIVSPNANMSKLREATKNYEEQFAPTMPNMPSLPKILQTLSQKPRPFGSLFIPSSDHKEIYYLALAWLMRNGWVTQLRTFAYIRVDPEVKGAVKDSTRETKPWSSSRPKAQRDDIEAGRDQMKPRQRPSVVSRPSSDGKRSYDGSWPPHNPRMASLVLSPPRASPEESKWLEYIEALITTANSGPFSLTTNDKAELQKYWPLFMNYLNGHIALETIAVREGLKRKFFWSLLAKIGLDLEHGIEDSGKGNKAVLVAFRHW